MPTAAPCPTVSRSASSAARSRSISREIADTRIPPGGRFRLDYARRLPASGLRLRVTVTVLPDEFYTRFFEAMLSAGAGGGDDQIRLALEATRRSAYTLYEKELA